MTLEEKITRLEHECSFYSNPDLQYEVRALRALLAEEEG